MKKILLTILVGLSLNSYADDLSAVSILSTASIMIVGSGMLSNSLSSLSESKTPTEYKNIKVDKVTLQKNDKVLINATVKDGSMTENLDIEVPSSVAKDTQVQPGQNIIVEKMDSGYILKANNKVLAVAPNEQGARLFKQQRIK
jgi:hypothetical protein